MSRENTTDLLFFANKTTRNQPLGAPKGVSNRLTLMYYMVLLPTEIFVVRNSPIIDLFLPCTIVTLVDNWLPSRLISSQLSRLRLLGISSERWGKYLVFSYSFESFFMLKVVLLVLSAFTFKNWRVFWVRFVLNGFNVSKCLSIHPYWFDAGQMPVIKNLCFFQLSDSQIVSFEASWDNNH